ncbi:orotidine-5'-phosphate decarboxylase [Helicobacter pametensis]|uniref:orotidine-5'-phosphate decarboxylase n=1 Tax=Helicobacter pametensis TaxID=95149 RepID=UPI00048A42F4|nr:orotidine-5'-phosphate decarboxylase [Helicobacter pametensis]
MELALALDLPSKEANLALLSKLREYPIWVKVGLRSFIRDGKGFLDEVKSINPNFKIFLDLKLYDIPNTMKTAAQECKDLGVDMITIHASSGIEAMREVMSVAQDSLLVFAVTALTSFDDAGFMPIYNAPIHSHAKTLALLAQEGGCHGIVCSPLESLEIKTSTSLKTLTPGIRFEQNASGDQKRIATPRDAKKAQADYIVVGRPIYEAQSPQEVVSQILEEIL